MLKAVRKKRITFIATLVSGLFLVWAAPPAFGLSFDMTAGCDELCRPKFFAVASAKDVAAALAAKPAARAYLRIMLRLAVKAGNAAAAAALLRAGAPPNGQEQPGRYDYMLHEAARRGVNLVSVLLDAGAFPGVVNKESRTPLHLAVRWGRPGAVALLHEAGADPRVTDDEGLTAVELARSRANLEPPRDWKQYDYDPYESQLPPPCRDCWDELIAMLLASSHAPPPCGKLCEAKFWESATTDQVRSALAQAPADTKWPAPGGGPLHLALAAGADVETVKLLLDHGITPNGRDMRDDTPLHVAARTPGGAGSVRLLLGRGAILDALNAKDWTPLHAASERVSTLENMRVLLDVGADPDIRAGETFGATPRHLAVSQPEGPKAAELILGYRGSNEVSQFTLSDMLRFAARSGNHGTVKLLLDLGADANASNIFGDTPFSEAYASGNKWTMLLLLWHGAFPIIWEPKPHMAGHSTHTDPSGGPLNIAVHEPAAVKLLLESGDDPNGKMLWGETPLHRAARICADKSLVMLLAHGADPNLRDRYGDTPLHEAVRLLANSMDIDRYRRNWLASCKKAKKKNEQSVECFYRPYELRGKCATNIATLIRHGADPGIGAEFRDNKNVSPLAMAKRYDLGDSIIGLMEEALRKNNR